MNGLRIESDGRSGLPSVLRTVIADLGHCYWLIDTQSGPFNISDKQNFAELESEFSRHDVPVFQFENSSTHLLKPGIFPRFLDLLVVDEWTYLVALPEPEVKAREIALELDRARWLTQEFFHLIEYKRATFLFHVHGWWELYTTDKALLEILATHGGISGTDSLKWLAFE
jgi:hypothetical protein